MINLDIIVVSTLARLILGLFAGAVASFVGWMTAFWVFKLVGFSPATFPAVTVMAIGAWVGLVVSLAWWHLDSPPRVGIINGAIITTVALVGGVIAFFLAMENPNFTWVERGFVFPVANASVLGANVVALGLYLYRVVVRREV